MRPTASSPQVTDRRRRVAAYVAGLGAFSLAFTAVPVALAPSALGTEQVTVANVEQAESVTFDDVRALVDQFETNGEVTFAGARRLSILLDFAEHSVNRGTPGSAVPLLEEFKVQASAPRYVPSESARDQLIAAADQLIAQLVEA